MSSVTTLSTYVYPGARVFAERVSRALPTLPTEVLIKTLSYLSWKDLSEASGVCRQFGEVATEVRDTAWKNYNPQKQFPKLKIIDRAVWVRIFGEKTLEEYGLTFDDVPALDDTALILENKARKKKIKTLHSLDLEKQGGIAGPEIPDPGITELTLPKGLSFAKLVVLTNEPVMGNRPKFDSITTQLTQESKAASIEKTHRILITNGILQRSRDLSYDNQKALVISLGGQMPSFLAATTLSLLTYMSSSQEAPVRLFNDDQRITYVVCAEPVLIGHFSEDGLVVAIDPRDGHTESSDWIGVGVMLKE